MRYVETGKDVSELLGLLKSGECFIHVFDRFDTHPIKNEPLVAMIRHFEDNEVYVVSFSHPDCIPTKIETLQLIANTKCKKYVLNRKNLLHYVDMKNCVDIGWCVYSETLEKLEIEKFRSTDTRSVPIMRMIKGFKDTFKLFYSRIKSMDLGMGHYELEFSEVLCELEKSGLYVNDFKLGDASLVDESQCVYTQYNLHTPTSRPSNRFGNVNYAALNKKTGDRDCFVSRYGKDGAVVMMDYESYHLRLFGNHVEFDLPDESLHGYLGKLYHGKEELTEEEYDLSKKITFNLIYGGISEDVRDNVPFMARIAEFVDETWKHYQKHGYVETWFYNRKLKSSIFDDKTNSYKVFNYLLQSAETERNCRVLKNIFEYLNDKTMQCVLYTYDAFLFDIPKQEFPLVPELKKIMDPNGDYPIRTYVGANYGDLREVSV